MRVLTVAVLLALPGAALAESTVAIERPIVLASDETGVEVAAYAIFANSGPATGIVGGECTCAEALEFHVVGVEHGMAEAWPLPLPENSRTAVEPPGIPRHFMLIRLKQPIAAGEKVKLRFKLENGEWIESEFVGVTNSREAWGS